ncbi:hypothetical protein [uncultured Clostridium sp.]|uniref:hypothetical protein n=1 Tax=uncultured Clostridium sp. TaxID=59620 RepID=UPI00260C05CE|nr:hypothetical protein [uncultured Clostridium sp.]
MIKKVINSEIDVEIKFDDVSDLLGLHAIKKTFETNTEISETKFIQNSILKLFLVYTNIDIKNTEEKK